jgi:hypothetical protein
MLPRFAEGSAFAYVVFVVALILAFVPAAIIARRTSLSGVPNRATGLGLGAIVGGVLIVSAVDIPSLQTGVLGLLVGVVLAAAAFVPRSSHSAP